VKRTPPHPDDQAAGQLIKEAHFGAGTPRLDEHQNIQMSDQIHPDIPGAARRESDQAVRQLRFLVVLETAAGAFDDLGGAVSQAIKKIQNVLRLPLAVCLYVKEGLLAWL
jgi:hypothetical protein